MRAGRVGWGDLAAFVDDPTVLWRNESSTFHGLNDRVSLAHADQLAGSLLLLHVGALRLRVFAPARDFGNPRRRVQA